MLKFFYYYEIHVCFPKKGWDKKWLTSSEPVKCLADLRGWSGPLSWNLAGKISPVWIITAVIHYNVVDILYRKVITWSFTKIFSDMESWNIFWDMFGY